MDARPPTNPYAPGAARPEPPSESPRPEDNASELIPDVVLPGGSYRSAFVRGLLAGRVGWSRARASQRAEDIRGANHGLIAHYLLIILFLGMLTWTTGGAP